MVVNTRKSQFGKYLVNCNNLSELGFKEWVFSPGMLFNNQEKWWVKGGKRTTMHEGIDVCHYRNQDNRICHLDKNTVVPVIYSGYVVQVNSDFLGTSAYLQHNIHNRDGRVLYSVYAHTKLYADIVVGRFVEEGSAIATIADRGCSKVSISEHLHLTLMWLPEGFPTEKLNWQTICDRSEVDLFDPNEFVVW